jgi:hypothetical protein
MSKIDLIKERCGIASGITVYDDEIESYIEDCEEDMIASGVKKDIIKAEKAGVITAITMYVKAHLGNDRSDTNKYMDLYRKKVFRLTLEGEEEVES